MVLLLEVAVVTRVILQSGSRAVEARTARRPRGPVRADGSDTPIVVGTQRGEAAPPRAGGLAVGNKMRNCSTLSSSPSQSEKVRSHLSADRILRVVSAGSPGSFRLKYSSIFLNA